MAFRVVAKIAAIALLSWTAADLTMIDLCALDHEGFAEAAESPEPEVHVDDCFCCSHCVEPSFEFHVDGETEEGGHPVVFAMPLVDTPHRGLFHPPQTSR